MNNEKFENFKLTTLNTSSTEAVNTHTFGDIFDLANSFLSIEAMTNNKLQKLCYYAKAWYLALYDENIITEDFEAWVHGAVQPELYHHYRSFGFQLIPKFKGDVSKLPETFLSFAREIYSSYGEFTEDQLEMINHKETPWINARKDLLPWQSGNNIISEDDMKTYYRGLMNNE